jgi:glutathione peroxidase
MTRHSDPKQKSLYEIPLTRLGGEPVTLDAYRGKVILAVNVASRCGKTPQYAGLQALFDRYKPQGLVVLGFPCNQFAREEPGDASAIAEFCSTVYGVTFPLFAKLQVNGRRRHPLYRILAEHPDDSGEAGDIAWNFEKFLIARDGSIARRFRPNIVPDDLTVVSAVESALVD